MSLEQKTFDHIVKKLRKQGKKSAVLAYRDGGVYDRCLFRNDMGARCAIGWCIDDDHYSPDLENKVPHHYAVSRAVSGSGFCPITAQRLMTVHDGEDVDKWELGFGRIARQHGLKYSPKEDT